MGIFDFFFLIYNWVYTGITVEICNLKEFENLEGAKMGALFL
jgi:hypothetical protein